MIILLFITIVFTCLFLCVKTHNRKHIVVKQHYKEYLKRAHQTATADQDYYKSLRTFKNFCVYAEQADVTKPMTKSENIDLITKPLS